MRRDGACHGVRVLADFVRRACAAKRTLSKYPIKDIVIYELVRAGGVEERAMGTADAPDVPRPRWQDSMDNGSAIQDALASLTGRHTVPNVFIGGKSIGGGDDTEALDRAGRLSTKLSEVSAI